MLELIPDLPDNVLGIRAKGKVTADDYQSVLVPAVESRLGQFRKLRLLYVLGDEFDEFTGSAAWEDAKIGMRHFTSFERIAVVTDVDWVARMVKAFGFVLPGEVRIFDNDDFDDARAWIGAPPSPGHLEFELLTGQSVLVLHPHGELEAGDFKRVATEVDPYMDRLGGLAGIVIVADEFPGWDDTAAFTAHFRFIRDHQSKIHRVALVTSSRFLSAVPKVANLFIDAEVRKFESDETNAAIAWAAKR
jgi:hypothetical protein